MLILLLYFIPLFYLLSNERNNDLAIDRVFRENPNPNPKFQVFFFELISGSIFRYPNFPLPELLDPNYPNAQGYPLLQFIRTGSNLIQL